VTAFRVALAGLGNAGYTLHLPALRPIADAVVVGACDLDAIRRERAARRFAVPVFDDYARMLDETRPDVVIVATPPNTHHDYVKRALDCGAHVLCEKPFVSSVAEADDLIAHAARVGRRIALNHQFREMPIFRAVREASNGSPENHVVFAQVWQLMDLPPWAEPGWRGEMLQRTLYEAGVHLVDFLMALFGEKPISASASVSTCGVREGQTDAVALVTLEFSRGRLAQVIQNRLCKGETQYFEVRVETPTASLRGSFGGRMRLSAGLHRSTRPHLRFDYGVAGLAWRERGNRRELLARNPQDPGMVATRFVLEKTLAAFRAGSEPPASAQCGRDVLEVIAACYHAAATGRRVMLDSDEARGLATLTMGAPPRA
jgi:scyllo-inositol 2-dehydrogenase (NADP+)